MIIKNTSLVESLQNPIVELEPTDYDSRDKTLRSEGVLAVGGRDYRVIVDSNAGFRVWARVQLAKAVHGDTHRLNKLVGDKCFAEGGAWANLCADPRDGETILTTTLTCDLSGEALGRFFAYARDFLAAHGEEVDELIASVQDDASDDDEDDDDFAFDVDDLVADGEGIFPF